MFLHWFLVHFVGFKLIRGLAGIGLSMIGAIILGICLIILVSLIIIDSTVKRNI